MLIVYLWCMYLCVCRFGLVLVLYIYIQTHIRLFSFSFFFFLSLLLFWQKTKMLALERCYRSSGCQFMSIRNVVCGNVWHANTSKSMKNSEYAGQFHLSTLIVSCLSFCIHHVRRMSIFYDDDNLPLQMTITSHFLTLFEMVITIHPSNVIPFFYNFTSQNEPTKNKTHRTGNNTIYRINSKNERTNSAKLTIFITMLFVLFFHHFDELWALYLENFYKVNHF